MWAPRHRSVVLAARGPRSLDGAGAGRLLLADGCRARRRAALLVQAWQRPASRSRLAVSARRRLRSIGDRRSRVLSVDRREWTGAPPRHRNVLYEMHIGTFTTAGRGARRASGCRGLRDLGVTTLEIMPLAEFSGRFGWGYDGVFLFAPFHEYGTPDDVRRVHQRCASVGLAVILDVVYNHLGPVGNFPRRIQRLVLRGARHRLGPRLQPRWSAFGAGPRVHDGQRPRTGSASTTSTACASTRCSRSSIGSPSTSSTS